MFVGGGGRKHAGSGNLHSKTFLNIINRKKYTEMGGGVVSQLGGLYPPRGGKYITAGHLSHVASQLFFDARALIHAKKITSK